MLFVSHQMNQIRRLCRQSIWLQDGAVRIDGPLQKSSGPRRRQRSSEASEANHRYCVQVLSWHLTNADGESSHMVENDGCITVRFRIKANIVIKTGHHSIALFRNDQMVWGMEVQNFELEPGVFELVYTLPSLPLAPGSYSWRLVFYDYRGALDVWDCRPPLIMGTVPANYARPEWTGLLNISLRVLDRPSDVRTRLTNGRCR